VGLTQTPCLRLVMRRCGVSNPHGGSNIAPPAADPRWGPYLDARSHVVAELADQVRLDAEAEALAWAAEPNAHMPAELIADVRVWRAATRVDVSELQPTGPRQLGRATRIFQEQTETGHGGNCSPHKSPALLRTHSCPELAEVERSLLPNPSADRGRLVRGSAWHLSGTGATTFR
jgi:hypothetical protein